MMVRAFDQAHRHQGRHGALVPFHRLARLDVQAHAAKRVHLHLAYVVRLDEIFDGDDRHQRPPLPPPRGPPPPPPNPPGPNPPPRWLPKIGAAVPAALVALRCAAVMTFVTTS